MISAACFFLFLFFRDASGNVIIEGLSQHANPFFYLALLVMVATAVAQVLSVAYGLVERFTLGRRVHWLHWGCYTGGNRGPSRALCPPRRSST